jgi:hypothetical protein
MALYLTGYVAHIWRAHCLRSAAGQIQELATALSWQHQGNFNRFTQAGFVSQHHVFA